MRNPITISEQIHKDKLIPSVYYPNMDELQPMYQMIVEKGDVFEALLIAFRFGFSAGNHCTIARGLKRI